MVRGVLKAMKFTVRYGGSRNEEMTSRMNRMTYRAQVEQRMWSYNARFYRMDTAELNAHVLLYFKNNLSFKNAT
jgi:hypothetical protein